MTEDVHDAVRKYTEWEHDSKFLDELDINRNDPDFLKRRFGTNLRFGTAGLRGIMGCGWNAMNPVTVQQATQGVCEYLINNSESGLLPPVVIGYDARHNSQWFAHIAAAVFMSKGVRVLMADSFTPTPLTPYLVKKQMCACGIQITASHNPAADNGFKLYASNGAQIIPPMDQEIHKCIVASTYPWNGVINLVDVKTRSLKVPVSSLCHNPMPQAWQDYKTDVATELGLHSSLSKSSLKVVYTALHGVASKFVEDFCTDVLGLAMDTAFNSVPQQRDPDPDFSTLAFPNPEEEGSLNMAMEHADVCGANMIIANDPDVDRFAASERIDGKWRTFSGDEIGIIFALIAFDRAAARHIPPERLLFVHSAVSSSFISRLCAKKGSTCLETLTGFKWLINTALEAQTHKNLNFCLAYEEALGYALSTHVPDKDGISGAAVWLQKMAELESVGKTMMDYLQEGRTKYGFFATHNSYFRCTKPGVQAAIMQKLRECGIYPERIAGYKIARIRDLKAAYDSTTEDKVCRLPAVDEDMITIHFENGARLTLRSSGTEPKLKFYSEMFHPSSSKEASEQLVESVEKVLTAIIESYESDLIRAGQ